MIIIQNRKLLRNPHWNYSSKGKYFITINTYSNFPYFGKIQDSAMILNKYGKVAKKFWKEIPEHFDNILLHNYIVMPNHIHGIVEICKSSNIVGKRHASSLQYIEYNDNKKYQRIPVVIGSYKSAVTKEINRIDKDLEFLWRKSYFDEIIDSEKSLKEIQKYIRDNPINWEIDGKNKIDIRYDEY